MGLFDKVRNLFTEEYEEEERPIKKETRYVEEPIKPTIEKKEIISKPVRMEQPVEEEEKQTREEKFVFFSDDDFKDLEKPKEEPKKIEEIKKEEKPLAYNGAVVQTKPEPRKEFKPSPIISPVYGVLDKNYKKEEIKTKKTSPRIYRNSTITIDDVRNKAYGTLEDDIKDDLLGRVFLEQKEEKVEADIDIFEELEKYEPVEDNSVVEEKMVSRSTSDVDEIFGKLDNKKDEIIEELDNKKEEILDEIDSKKESFDLLMNDLEEMKEEPEELDELSDDIDLAKNLLDDENLLDEEDDDTEALAQELEEQKKKLEEINSMMNENEKATKTKTKKKKEIVEDDLEDSELFDLIDSMYEKKDDE